MTETPQPGPDGGPARKVQAAHAAHHHFFEQAPVPALDVDGINVVTVGTLLFALASVAAAVLYPDLEAAGRGWWLGVCVSGTVLGLLGVAYCFRLKRRRLRRARPGGRSE